MTNPLLLLALLCCAVGCAAAEDTEFRCMYDEVAERTGEVSERIVEPGPDSSYVKGATMSSDTAEWEAIRFRTFTEDLNNPSQYCTAEGQERPTFTSRSQTSVCDTIDVFTEEKKETLLNHMIPAALKLHSDRLLVQRRTKNIKVSRYTRGPCSAFTVPESHKSEGVADADMVMYIAAGPTGSLRAFSSLCSRLRNGRPFVGIMNVGPGMIRNNHKGIRVVAHETAHALGFGYSTMQSLNMVSAVPDIRGQTRQVVTSDATQREARAHYNCDRIAGMELENEGGQGTSMSHWERRNARDELMAGFGGVGYYTALTLSAFESMGYYRANWGMEETMEWGRNKGCPFLKEKCVSHGTTNYPDMFCTDPSASHVCSFGRKGIGMCTLGKYTSPLPDEFQYFSDPTMGGSSSLLDFCPIVAQYDNTGCSDGDTDSMPGSRVGPNSVCLKGEGLNVDGYSADAVQDICAEISCKDDIVSVRYAGDDEWHHCPEDSRITPKGSFTGGAIVCPSYAEVCGSKQQTDENNMESTIDNKVDTDTTTSTSSTNKDMPSKRTDNGDEGTDGTVTSTTRPAAEDPTGGTEALGSSGSNADSTQYLNRLHMSVALLYAPIVYIYVLLVFLGLTGGF